MCSLDSFNDIWFFFLSLWSAVICSAVWPVPGVQEKFIYAGEVRVGLLLDYGDEVQDSVLQAAVDSTYTLFF